MIIIVVDDEEIILSGETAVIRQCAPGAEVHGFSSPNQALEYLRAYSADVAFLDLEMPGINGLELARLMKAVAPRLNIIFATAYREYAENAINLRASGYLLKPITADRIREELENLRYPVSKNKNGLFVRAFGSFEVFYDGSPMLFRYNKTKEMFAYLIDRRGAMVSRDELITVLWGGESDRASYYKQVQKDLNDILARAGKEHALIKQRGSLGILVDEINCDYYDWLKGDPKGLNAFMGEYMRQYDWGEETLVNITNWGVETAMIMANGVLELYCAGLGLLLLLPARMGGKGSRASRMSRHLFIVSVLMLLCDGIALCFLSDDAAHSAVYRVLEGLSFVCFYAIIALYTWYLLEILPNRIASRKKWLLVVNTTSCVIGMLLWSSNCLRPFFFDIAARQATEPMIYNFSMLPGIVPVLGDLTLIIYNRKDVSLTELLLLLIMPLLPLISSVIGQIAPGLSLQYALVFASMVLNHRYFDEVMDQELARKELDLQEYRMRMTLARVKPHYIYNVLTTIYYLCERDPRKAQETITAFSAYLRELARNMEQKLRVPFSWELDLIRNYLKLEKLRFGDRLTYEFHIQESSFYVLPFTVQQLVENAVKHGMHTKNGVHIRVESERAAGGCRVRVQDNGVGFENVEVSEDEPSGLRNIRDLLAFKNSGTLTVRSEPGKGTDAVVFFRAGLD